MERARDAEALWYVGPGKTEIRAEPVAAPACRRGSAHGALQRHQPRYRAPRLQRPGSRERVRPHARAPHGRCLPVPGEIRLCNGRAHRDRGPRRPHRLRALPAPDGVQSAGRRRDAVAGGRAGLARGARRQHGDGAQRRLGRRPGPRRPHRRGRRRGGRRAVRMAVRQAARTPKLRSSTSSRNGRRSRPSSASPSRCRSTRRRIATSSSMRAPRPPALRRRCGSPATRRASSSSPGTVRPR